jgi:hypothetical protein
MFLVVEKMGATVEDDGLLLVFWRLGGGALGEPPVLFAEAILQNEASKIMLEVASKSDGKPRNGFLQMKWKKKQH